MDARLDQGLRDIETAFASIETAVGAGDLEAAGLCNRALHVRLERFGVLLDEFPPRLVADSRELIAARLSSVFQRHALLAQRLSGERDLVADELGGIRAGRHAASRYLDAAAG
jgi:hypothetical protein